MSTNTLTDNPFLAQISSEEGKWDRRKVQSLAVAQAYRDTDYDCYSLRIRYCSYCLSFDVVSNSDEATLRLNSAQFCRVRHCPICQWRRSLMWVARFIDALPRILHDHPTAKFIHLTLTVRNCDVKDLRETLKSMNKAWERLTHRKQFPAIGWVKAIEVTRNEEEGSEWYGTAHPHIHALLMVTPTYFSKHYLSHEKWVDLWQSCLKVPYRPSVHVRTIKPKTLPPPPSMPEISRPRSIPEELQLHPDQLEPPFSSIPTQAPLATVPQGPQASLATVPQELVKAACEVLKYTVKPQDLVIGGSWLVDLTEQLHKTRAIATGGVFKEYLAETEENSEDLEAAKELIEAELGEPIIFNWKDKVKRYKQA